MRITLLSTLLLVQAALAEPDPSTAYRNTVKKLKKREIRYWHDFQREFQQALRAFERPWLVAHTEPKTPQDPTPDYSGFQKLYDLYTAIETERGEALVALARSGHPKALPTVFRELLATSKQVDAVEKELAGDLVLKEFFLYDQRIGTRGHGLARRSELVVRALAESPGAAPFLAGDGWKQAVRKDGKRSIVRRVAVIDAMGLSRDLAALPFLEERLRSRASTFRVAALEALLRRDSRATKALLPLLADPSPVVRIALLQGIRDLDRTNARWIQPVLDGYRNAVGRLRAEHVATLEALTRQRFGDDAKRWNAWYIRHAKAIDEGAFDVDTLEIEEGGRRYAQQRVIFYGRPAPTRGVIFVLDGSRRLLLPAEVSFQRTKLITRWPPRSKNSWHNEHPDHESILDREFGKTLASLPKEALFGVVALHTQNDAEVFGPHKADALSIKNARKFVESLPKGGSATTFAGLLAAYRMAGLDPSPGAADFPVMRADTVYLLHPGKPGGGRYAVWQAEVEAFRRLNRFRRLLVHTIRICNQKTEAEALMRGLAEASGGTYSWQKNPPPKNR